GKPARSHSRRTRTPRELPGGAPHARPGGAGSPVRALSSAWLRTALDLLCTDPEPRRSTRSADRRRPGLCALPAAAGWPPVADGDRRSVASPVQRRPGQPRLSAGVAASEPGPPAPGTAGTGLAQLIGQRNRLVATGAAIGRTVAGQPRAGIRPGSPGDRTVPKPAQGLRPPARHASTRLAEHSRRPDPTPGDERPARTLAARAPDQRRLSRNRVAARGRGRPSRPHAGGSTQALPGAARPAGRWGSGCRHPRRAERHASGP